MSDKQRKLKDKASQLFSDGKLKDAIKAYQQVVAEDPTEIACQIKIGDIYRRLGQRANAVEAYEPVARHYAEDGLMLKAVAVCKLILSVDPAHTATQEMLANLYTKRPAPGGPRRGPVPAMGLGQPAAQGSREIAIEIDEEDDGPMEVVRNEPRQLRPDAAPQWPPSPPQWPGAGPAVIVGAKVEGPAIVRGEKLEAPPAPEGATVPVVRGERVEAPAAVLSAWPGAVSAPPAAEAVEAGETVPPSAPATGAAPILSAWPAGGAPPAPLMASWPGASPVTTPAAWPPAPSVGPEMEAAEGGSMDLPMEDPVLADGSEDEPLDVVSGETAAPEGDEVVLAEGPVALEEVLSDPEAPVELTQVVSGGAAPAGEESLVAMPQIPLFSDLPREAFIQVLVQMSMREMAPGDLVIRQGEVGNSFFVLAGGKVRVVRKEADGAETVLAFLSDGAFFGEMALLQNGPRTASVIVEEDSQIFEISKSVLDQVVQSFPSVERVLRNFYTQRLLSTTMATHPLFRGFDPEERRRLMERFKSRPFNAGDVILEEGKKGEGLYLLLSGVLEVSKLKDGSQVVIAELGAGDLFGEMSLLTNKPTNASVVAVSDCFVLRLSKRHFDELIMTHPQILELVSQVSADRETENAAIFGGWTPPPETGAALV